MSGAQAFLARAGWDGAEVAPLAGDASNRTYFRVRAGDDRQAVLMEAPPTRGEDVAPFIDVTARLRGLGLSAPAIHAEDRDAGYLLLEDLGDALYARLLEREPAREEELYAAAVDVLVEIVARPGLADGLPSYDIDAYLAESHLATDWYLPAAQGRPVPAATRTAFGDAVTAAIDRLSPHPPVCVLRDYHAENLVWLPRRHGVARVGLLDYQDALAGHPAYDLVSLVEDARRDLAPGVAGMATARFRRGTGIAGDALTRDLAILGAQRNLKILGIFARLWLRDGKPAYLDLMPRVWQHLERDLRHPDLAPLAAWVARHLPSPDAELRARIRAAR